MQLDFPELQKKQVELLSANPYFAACPVFEDDGNKKTQIETALRETGAAILVCPVLNCTRGSQATHQITLTGENVVKLLVNPTRNAGEGGAHLNILKSIVEILRTVLAYARTGGDTFWTVPTDTVVINTFDPGLWIYDVFFQKQFVI